MRTLLALAAAAILVPSMFTGANALDRRVNIENRTGVELVRFYASNVGTNNWEEDILGRATLPSGYSTRVNMNDGSGYCRFDFKAVFADGQAVVRRGVNVCAVGTYTYYP